MAEELISREAALDALRDEMCTTGYQSRAMGALCFVPTIAEYPDDLRKKWIVAANKLPEEKQLVLAYTPHDGFMFVGFVESYTYRDKKVIKWRMVTAMRGTQTLTEKVACWMPLPEPPRED